MPDLAAPSVMSATASSFPDGDELCPDIDHGTGIDLSLIRENLKLTPWERILANDDAVNFCDTAREALKRRHAAS
ncbi:MAG: hypothetical protein U0984_09065 [Prosthecobacter sp.]|nr:hypothetical protein [Prosthecobacter sp.]